MRLDLFLKHTGLIKRRTVAKEMCDGGKVSRNGNKAQPADEVRIGDTLAISYGARRLEAKILDVPRGQVPKAQRENYFQVTSETAEEEDW
jgi:ribosomal 50S subunit-recycling heat shock protein